MLACYVLTLSDLHVWCLTMAIHEMTAINEITAKMDHVPFTCNWFIVLRKWAHSRCMLLQKRYSENISKFPQILATAMKSISRKESFLKVVNVLWKRNSATIVFLYYDINLWKLWKCLVHGNSFSIYCSGVSFLFLWFFLIKGAVVQHSCIM